jgi:hypothetical protein
MTASSASLRQSLSVQMMFSIAIAEAVWLGPGKGFATQTSLILPIFLKVFQRLSL